MPNVNGLVTTYDVPENARDISDIFYAITHPSTPLLNMMLVGRPTSARSLIWWEDVLHATQSLVAATYTAADGDIELDDASGVRIGTILKVEDSIYRATAVNYTTNVVDIAIVANDANHVIGIVVEFLTTSRKEGAGKQDSDTPEREKNENPTQIIDDYIEVSGTQEAVELEIADPASYTAEQVDKKLRRIWFEFNRNLWHGIKVAPTDNLTPRIFGGTIYWIEQNGYTPSPAAFGADNLDVFLLKMKREFRGDTSQLWMNSVERRKFTALNDSKIRTVITEATAGSLVTRYQSGNGDIYELIIDDDIPDKKIVSGLIPQFAVLHPMRSRQFFIKTLPEEADSKERAIIGEYTFELNPSNRMGIFESI